MHIAGQALKDLYSLRLTKGVRLPPAPLYVNSLWLERLRECGLQPASCAQKGLLAPKKESAVLQCFPTLSIPKSWTNSWTRKSFLFRSHEHHLSRQNHSHLSRWALHEPFLTLPLPAPLARNLDRFPSNHIQAPFASTNSLVDGYIDRLIGQRS